LAEYCRRKVPPRMPDAEGSEDDLPLAAFCPRSSEEDWPLSGQEIGQVASKSYWVAGPLQGRGGAGRADVVISPTAPMFKVSDGGAKE
jgi:hypothetical protein